MRNILYYDELGDPVFQYEFVTFDELFDAYLDCKRHKNSSENCIAFQLDANKKLYQLWIDLNTWNYRVGKSICFVTCDKILKNKYREIFAADFIDRIVQHLLIRRLNIIFEDTFIDKTFSCRKGKGTLAAAKSLANDIKKETNNYTEDAWIVQADIKCFFASINKFILLDIVTSIVKSKWSLSGLNNKDLQFTLWIIKKIIMYDPRKNCILKQSKNYWKKLSKDKSAFHIPFERYLAVGNITSQYFANIYLHEVDEILSKYYKYNRYVDDTSTIIKDKSEFQKVIKMLEDELDKVKLKLNYKKIHLLHYSKGVKFVGKIIKPNRMYVSNLTIGKFWQYLALVSKELKKQNIPRKELEYIVNRANSYIGLMIHTNSYNIRKRILTSSICAPLNNFCYTNKKMSKLIIYNEELPYYSKKNHKSKSYKKFNKFPILEKNLH